MIIIIKKLRFENHLKSQFKKATYSTLKECKCITTMLQSEEIVHAPVEYRE